MAYRETAQVRARKAAQRENLLGTAEMLVREGGFAAMTMQAVAERAGVGVGTLYRYFDNKATLAAEVFRVATEREVEAVARALSGPGGAGARLEQALRVFAGRAMAAPKLAWALIAEPVEPEVDAERLHYRATYAALYRDVLDHGVASGELPPQATAPSAAALVGAVAEALVGPLAAPLADAALPDQMVAFCLRAVGATPSQSRQPQQNTTTGAVGAGGQS
ncbi:TetR/AcrR family transcriptional regulator [Alloalcanivorax xenomutans]|uniref:TetR/AcrR family transcriptional regulator n=1 Tax=Alloalcanivorax xenomutans TaxID=1094342 RepID=UPI0024E1F34D|nr:TetR/AcrR family transcriptional regulator [Alloalcanivorax xenomutans]